MKKKPATAKAWDMRAKLQALVERGINGERDAAKIKLARLESRIDFTGKDTRGPDLFAGVFQKSTTAEPLARVENMEIASFAKWAMEERAQVECLFRDGQLWAQVTRKTAAKLVGIVSTVSESFTGLWAQFAAAPGVHPGDRSLFWRGLYDGMIADDRNGEALPSRICAKRCKSNPEDFVCKLPAELQHFADFNRAVEKKCEMENGTVTWIRYFYAGKCVAQSAPDLNQVKLREAFYKLQGKAAKALAVAPGLSLHPYEVALGLGKSIRFCVPMGSITEELSNTIKGAIEA